MSAPMACSATQGAGDSTQPPTLPVRIQILHVPDCPLVDGLRALVARCVAQSAASVIVEEIEGPYMSPTSHMSHMSPTLLVNGQDVTGLQIVDAPSCRLVLPTGEQILAALAEAHASAPLLRASPTSPG
ncbi:MAG: alkylmercury lyase [Acidimicrobiales bacterium]